MSNQQILPIYASLRNSDEDLSKQMKLHFSQRSFYFFNESFNWGVRGLLAATATESFCFQSVSNHSTRTSLQ